MVLIVAIKAVSRFQVQPVLRLLTMEQLNISRKTKTAEAWFAGGPNVCLCEADFSFCFLLIASYIRYFGFIFRAVDMSFIMVVLDTVYSSVANSP